LLKLLPPEDADLATAAWLITCAWLVDANLSIIWVAVTGFRPAPFVFPILREDPEEARFRGVVDAPAVFAALGAASRSITPLALGRALEEPSRNPCADLLDPAGVFVDLLAPARLEELRIPVAVARVTALILLTLPFAFVTWLEK